MPGPYHYHRDGIVDRLVTGFEQPRKLVVPMHCILFVCPSRTVARRSTPVRDSLTLHVDGRRLAEERPRSRLPENILHEPPRSGAPRPVHSVTRRSASSVRRSVTTYSPQRCPPRRRGNLRGRSEKRRLPRRSTARRSQRTLYPAAVSLRPNCKNRSASTPTHFHRRRQSAVE